MSIGQLENDGNEFGSAALKVVAFFDIFNFPLTAFELWQYLEKDVSFEAVVDELNIKDSVTLSGLAGVPKFAEKNGFYFLSGREDLIEKRREFNILAEKKFKIAKRAAGILRFIPSIKMIAVCNNFYYRAESDIDFLIITEKNRLWLTRFWATIILDIFRLRARGKNTADKICLSFYLSEENLNLEKLKLSPEDPYFNYWLASLEPIYGQEMYEKFWSANSWLKMILPNISSRLPSVERRITDNVFSNFFKKIKSLGLLKKLDNFWERIVKKIQWFKLASNIKTMASLGDSRVVINDSILKFHENDRREEFGEKHKTLISNYQSSIKNE